MSKKLVLLHGRAQQNKDAGALKSEWLAALKQGLAKSGLQLPIADRDIRFPYYGDTLQQLARGARPDSVDAVVIRGPKSAEEREFMCEVMEEVCQKLGITPTEISAAIPAQVLKRGPLSWRWFQGILRVIDQRVPCGSAASIYIFAKDVFDYLTKRGISDTIDTGVCSAIGTNEAAVVVSHSLGTVVAYNILRREGQTMQWDVPLFVTLGSPLGVTRIRQSLSPTTFPSCVGRWMNAFDKRDMVALHSLAPPHFNVRRILNHNHVQNGTENRHGISGYLSDPVVAKAIHDALL